ncbi:MAG: DUF192 domain-containing protein [Nitrospira sp.]|nr:DUF192 domain-containing protein [Nitrospira sp.]
MKRRWLIFLIVCLWPSLLMADEQVRTILVELPSGTKITAEVADTIPKRMLGLMFREHLSPAHGMLFIFENADYHGIWMKNCRIPLDILWLNQDRRIIHMEEGVPPCKDNPCPTYQPLQKALYVLELNAGLIAKEKMKLGAQLKF